ncbi:MAG: phosphoglycolate phosphatase [Gammaproteobacteria bacterium SG8_47]|nr:MAG: phosphoglycolate phosphatase [Gammaproteobacteria bacterium SG8_47]
MALRKPDMILVDVDGTMVDSVPDLAFCVDEMMKNLGSAPWGEAKVRTWVGNGVERLVKRSLTNDMEAEPDGALYERALPIFTALYAENTSKRSRLYPGVSEALDYLAGAGYKLGCVTNKAAQFTIPLLKDLGVYERFAIVVSGDTLAQQKPDPAPLLHAAQFFGVGAEQSLMVGDSVSDVKAARAAGFQIVCMSYGYNHGLDIRDAKPDAVMDNMTELRGLLDAATER